MYTDIYTNIMITLLLAIAGAFVLWRYGYKRQGFAMSNLILAYIFIFMLANITYTIRSWNVSSDMPLDTNDRAISDSVNLLTESPLEAKVLDKTHSPQDILPILANTGAENHADYVHIDTEYLSGAINLAGGNIDNLALKKYIDAESQPVKLLRTNDTALIMDLYDPRAKHFWQLGTQKWQLMSAADQQLSADTPIVIQVSIPNLGTVNRVFSITDHYLITVTDTIINDTNDDMELHAYAKLSRPVQPTQSGSLMGRDQVAGWVDNNMTFIEYSDLEEARQVFKNNNQWLAFSDLNWVTAIVVTQDAARDVNILAETNAQNNTYDLIYITKPEISVAKNQKQTMQTWSLLAIPKQESLLNHYETTVPIRDIAQTKNWGWMSFINFPLYQGMQVINNVVQNYGWSIIILTLIIRLLLSPLMFKIQKAARIMRVLKPQIEHIRVVYKDQPEQLNHKIIALYRQYKINPLTSLMLIIPQIPIMYAIWSLTQDISFNNQPFILWMHNIYAVDSYVLFDFAPLGIFVTCLGVITSISLYFGFIKNLNQTINISTGTKAIMVLAFSWVMSYLTVGMAIYLICNNLITPVQNWLLNLMLDKHEKLPSVQ